MCVLTGQQLALCLVGLLGCTAAQLRGVVVDP